MVFITARYNALPVIQARMDLAEAEFLAEKQLVTIIPNFSENKLSLISGDFGPFNPSMPVDVPLWLALDLKQRHRCHIQPPSWLSVDVLIEAKQSESSSELFVPMPSPYYMEVGTMLLNKASDDIPQADETRALLKDLWDLRTAKLRKSVGNMVAQQATYGKLDSLTLMEISSVRPILTQSLDQLQCLRTLATQHSSPSQDDSTF